MYIYTYIVYGLYVIDECNIETHGMQPLVGRLAEDPAWVSAYLHRLSRMYHRDKGHTCVIGWSLGNESGYTTLHNVMYTWLKVRDGSRFVMYEPASYGGVSSSGSSSGYDITGIDNPHEKRLIDDNSSDDEEVTLINMIRNWFTSIITTSIAITNTNTNTKVSNSTSKHNNNNHNHNNNHDNNTTANHTLPIQDSDFMATDILCPMYARTDECIRLSHLYPSLPLIQCEYAHMMGRLYSSYGVY